METDICSIVTQKLRETDTFVVEGNGDTDYIIKRHRKDEIRDHGDTCPTLTESHDHHGGANLPMLVIHNLQQRSEKRPSVAADKNAGGAGPLSKCDGTTYCVEGANLQAVEVKSGLRHARGFETRDDDISHCLKGAEGGSSQVHLYIQNIPHGHNTGWKKELPNLRAHKGAPYNELLVQGTRIRRLTPKERERLQGFPDGFTKWGIDEKTGEKVGISDSQRYKMLGNAVTVPVVKAIGRRLMEECNP